MRGVDLICQDGNHLLIVYSHRARLRHRCAHVSAHKITKKDYTTVLRSLCLELRPAQCCSQTHENRFLCVSSLGSVPHSQCVSACVHSCVFPPLLLTVSLRVFLVLSWLAPSLGCMFSTFWIFPQPALHLCCQEVLVTQAHLSFLYLLALEFRF